MGRFATLIGLLSMSIALLALTWPMVSGEYSALLEKALLPYRVARLSAEPPETELLMPVEGVRVEEVADTWGAPRSQERQHEGQDLFAPEGTPVYAPADGYVMRVGQNRLGGNVVFVLGRGGRGYYFAHLESFGPDANVGQRVSATSTLGYVGDSGNAEGGPPHLHFGIYAGGGTIDPLPLLRNRESI